MKGYVFAKRCLPLFCIGGLAACAAAQLEDHPIIEPLLIKKSVLELQRCIEGRVERLPPEHEVERRSYASRYGRRVTFYVWVDGKLTEEVVLIRRDSNAAEIRAYALAERLVDADTNLQFVKACANVGSEASTGRE